MRSRPGRSFDLRPLGEERREDAPFGVVDIETARWTRFLVAGAYTPVLGFWERRDLARFLGSLARRADAPSVWYAHFGGQFDFLFFLRAMLGRPREWRVRSLLPRGSRLLSMDVEHLETGRVLTFRDSSALLPFALRGLAETFGVQHQKLEIDYRRITRVTPRLLRYLEHDCRALYEVLQRFQASPLISRVGMKPTIASQALQVFRGTLAAPVPALAEGIDRILRSAYAGGRTEIFKPYFQRAPGGPPLSCVDVNSLYPAVMHDLAQCPGRYLGITRRPRWEAIKAGVGFVRARVRVKLDVDVPILWVKRYPNERGQRVTKFVFPVGEFEGLWPLPEFKLAIECGQVSDFDLQEFHAFSDLGPIFKPFVETLYAQRSKSTSPVEKTIAKLLMNSLYGRMGLRRDREGIEIDDGRAGLAPTFELRMRGGSVRFCKVAKTIQTFSNVAIAAYVTAHARMKLWGYLRHADPYYCDTDSIFTESELPTGAGLGELKLEYTTDRAAFLLPKTYIAGSKVTMKGFASKKIQHFTFQDFECALEGDLRALKYTEPARFAKFKTALKKGRLVTMSEASVRRIQSRYDKRVVFKNSSGIWATRPRVLEISKGEIK